MTLKLRHEVIPGEKHFRWRAGEITRLEAFTDAVFGFALPCWWFPLKFLDASAGPNASPWLILW